MSITEDTAREIVDEVSAAVLRTLADAIADAARNDIDGGSGSITYTELEAMLRSIAASFKP